MVRTEKYVATPSKPLFYNRYGDDIYNPVKKRY